MNALKQIPGLYIYLFISLLFLVAAGLALVWLYQTRNFTRQSAKALDEIKHTLQDGKVDL